MPILILIAGIGFYAGFIYWAVEKKGWNGFAAAFVAMILALPILFTLAVVMP